MTTLAEPPAKSATKPCVEVRAGPLAAAMKAAAAITQPRNTIKVLANVRLIAAGGRLTVTTNSLDCQYSHAIDCEAGDIALTVDARRLAAIAAALPGDAALRITDEDGRATFKCGRSRWTLPTIGVSDFPVLAAADLCEPVTFDAAALAGAFKRVDWAVCNELTRAYLSGAFLHPEDGRVRLTALNGHCLALIDLPEMFPVGAAEVIVPRHFTAPLIAGAFGKTVELSWSERIIRARGGDVEIIGKLIDGIYPDYRRAIPQPGDCVTVERESLAAAINRAALVASDRDRCIKFERGRDSLTLSVTSPDSGVSGEDVPASCDAPPVTTGFNHAYLRYMLAAIGGETVEIHQQDAGAPALFRRVVGDGSLGVIMPLRV